MKTSLLIAVLLCAASLPLCGAEPPELEEWFRITGDFNGPIGRIFSYLPDFEPARGGTNATVVSVYGAKPTWYNRYHGDTIDQFRWPVLSGGGMRKADLNSDGIDEYMTQNGKVHRGLGNGMPPEQEYIDYVSVISSVVPFEFHDINNDGYTDAIANSSYSSPTRLLKVLWGGPDLLQLNVSEIFRRRQGNNNESLAGVLPQKSAEGKVRIITRSYEESGFQQAKWISYVLRELTPVREADTVRFEIATLDSISDAGFRPAGEFDLFDGLIFQSRHDQPVLFLTALKGRNSVQVYCLDEGRFRKTQEFTPKRLLFPNLLRGSANDDPYEDLVFAAGTELYFYAGTRTDVVDSVPYGYKTLGCDVTEAYVIQCIGDVTGDGVGDIGEAYNNDTGCFRILKGIANRTVDVPGPGAGSLRRPFEMYQNYPNPVGGDRTTTVPFSNERPQHLVLALYTLGGGFVGELFSGYVPSGEHELQVDLRKYTLPSGMYVLRLGNGEFVRERGILLTD